jgi:succinate dehydrogenase / fumarate reductase cytochrome b subunit
MDMALKKLTNNSMLWRYKWRAGMINWLFHRISGLALVLYICAHMFVVSSLKSGAVSDKAAFDRLAQIMHNPVLTILEIALLAAVLYHTFNGIRVMAVDFFNGSKRDKLLNAILWIAFLGVFIPSGLVMFLSIFK